MRRDADHLPEGPRHLGTAMTAIAFLLAGYLGFFALIFLDEVVFKTRLLSKVIPPAGPVTDVLRTIYWPLLKLVKLLKLA